VASPSPADGRKISTRQADHHHVKPAGESTSQRANRVFERYTVIDSFAPSTDPWARKVLTSMVRHLHAFAREVELTIPEWETAIDFLTRTGQKCDADRQESILLSDVLGLSMLTETIPVKQLHAQVTLERLNLLRQ
jgi:hypothetical protein